MLRIGSTPAGHVMDPQPAAVLAADLARHGRDLQETYVARMSAVTRRRAAALTRPPMAGSVSVESQRFAVTVVAIGPGKLLVPVPFNPDRVWGAKQRHHIAGTVNGIRVRAVIEAAGDGFGFTLGPTSPARGVAVGDEVTVEIAPEGPQRADLAEDVAAALAAN